MIGIEKKTLVKLYIKEKKSMQEVADLLGCSLHKVSYWMGKQNIITRKLSDAIYIKHNPNGDPFKFSPPISKKDFELWGMGLGLYWGEGNKANKNTVKIGNSDPGVLKVFMRFMEKFFNVPKQDLKFHLHVFTDIDINRARQYWINFLGIKEKQFYKPTITQTGKLGTYRKKSKYGVLTLYYGNTKLRNILVQFLPHAPM